MKDYAQVLLVEDNSVDREAVRRGFRRHRLGNAIVEARDGFDALQLLRGDDNQPALQRPYVVVLDIGLPRMSGIELLRELRRDDELHDSVVFVLTTSRSERDKAAAYSLNVAGYIVKEDLDSGYGELASLLEQYCSIVELPGKA